MIEAFLRGAVLAFALSACFGPVTLAVVRACLEGRIREGALCAAGSTLVEAAQSWIAYLGVATLLDRFPRLVSFLCFVAGMVLVAMALRKARRAPGGPPPPDVAAGTRAFGQGVALTVLNPFPLLGWIALAPTVYGRLAALPALAGVVGIALGVLGWFGLVIELTRRGRSLLGGRARVVARLLDGLLASFGVVLVFRGLAELFTG